MNQPTPSTTTATPETCLPGDPDYFCQWCYDRGLRYSTGPWGHAKECPHAPPRLPTDAAKIADLERRLTAALAENAISKQVMELGTAKIEELRADLERAREERDEFKASYEKVKAINEEIHQWFDKSEDGRQREWLEKCAQQDRMAGEILDKTATIAACHEKADRLRSELDASKRREGVLRGALTILATPVFRSNGDGTESDNHPTYELREIARKALGAGSEEGRGE